MTRLMPRGRGVMGRTLVVFGVTAIALIALNVGLLRSLSTAEDAVESHDKADAAMGAVSHIEEEIMLLANAEQDALFARAPQLLSRHIMALQHLPEHLARFDDLEVELVLEPKLDAVSAGVQAYLDEWVAPLVAAAAVSPEAAVQLMTSGEGQRRMIELSGWFVEFQNANAEFSAARGAMVANTAGHARRLANIVLGGVLVTLFGAVLASYFLIARPVEGMVDTTTRFAAGDLTARSAESGIQELKTLGAVFNEMAATVQSSRSALARQGAELRAVLDATTDGIIVSDLNGQITFTNAAAIRGWPSGLRIAEHGAISTVFARLAEMTTTPHIWDETVKRLALDPDVELTSEFTLRDTGQSFIGYTGPVVGADGTPIGRLYVGRETTAERNAELAKEQFVATVSHELRTPLTSILGYIELALDEPGDLDAQLVQFLTVAQRNAVRLHEMVDDLLVMSQVQTDRLTFDMAPVGLAEVVENAVEEIRPLADKKELMLDLAIPETIEIVGDRSRLSGLVGNLLSNAVKFTPNEGTVEITLHRVGRLARIVIADSGIGISESDQERLFERFFRAETARESVIPGTGLGLAICRAIAEAHGGTISVSSTVGQGTRFVVDLPTAGTEGPP